MFTFSGVKIKLSKINLKMNVIVSKVYLTHSDDSETGSSLRQACRKPGMHEPRMPARCGICRQFVIYLMFSISSITGFLQA